MGTPEIRHQLMKHQLRTIECFPDGHGFAVGSTEGRVSWEFFDNNAEIQKKKYAFKCHRKTVHGQDLIFPVNAISFHPIYGTFATGGCDGVVAVWDGNNKKRLWKLPEAEASIVSLSFSGEGGSLAVAESTKNKNPGSNLPISVTIREMTDQEVMPRIRQPG
eukprot:GHVL01017296.1.p1 GENE.GHVL01017296.1~~GHVL01017296.1.p1  ORF type:complete len:162 (+),score=25.78 GHVL01017296.1:222-707(+)